MRIKVKNLQDVEEKFLAAVQIIHRMRKAQKIWHQVYGCHAKMARKNAEALADEFLKSLQLTDETVKIGIELENEKTEG